MLQKRPPLTRHNDEVSLIFFRFLMSERNWKCGNVCQRSEITEWTWRSGKKSNRYKRKCKAIAEDGKASSSRSRFCFHRNNSSVESMKSSKRTDFFYQSRKRIWKVKDFFRASFFLSLSTHLRDIGRPPKNLIWISNFSLISLSSTCVCLPIKFWFRFLKIDFDSSELSYICWPAGPGRERSEIWFLNCSFSFFTLPFAVSQFFSPFFLPNEQRCCRCRRAAGQWTRINSGRERDFSPHFSTRRPQQFSSSTLEFRAWASKIVRKEERFLMLTLFYAFLESLKFQGTSIDRQVFVVHVLCPREQRPAEDRTKICVLIGAAQTCQWRCIKICQTFSVSVPENTEAIKWKNIAN